MLEHWHPQLIREEAALVFSTDREVALSTRVARMIAWVNMVDQDSSVLEDNFVLTYFSTQLVYICDWEKIEIIWDFLPGKDNIVKYQYQTL